MVHDHATTRSPGAALHAVLAVLLTLMVTAAAPVTGVNAAAYEASVRLVEANTSGLHAIVSAALAADDAIGTDKGDSSASHGLDRARSFERAQWRSALPPPACA